MNENIDKTQIVFYSAIYGFLISILLVFVGHLSNSDRTFMPESSSYGYYSGASKTLWGSYKCAFGLRHEINTDGVLVYEFSTKSLPTDKLLSDTFSHNTLLTMIGLISTVLISLIWIMNADKNKFKEIK